MIYNEEHLKGNLSFNGFEVFVDDNIKEQPVIELSHNLMVTPEFRKKCNEYYVKMFGYKEVAYVVQNKMIVNTIVFNKLKRLSYEL